MSTIPTAFARVPNLLSSRMMMGNLTRTNSSLMGLQSQLATGIRVMRPSVDPVAASTITSLDFMIEQRAQHLRNLNHADSLLATIDQSLGDISDLILEAKGIGLSQIGVGSDAETRANQAQVVDSILQSLADIANREQGGIHFFGGQAVSTDPMAELNGFYRYVGFGDSMQTDLGMAAGVGVTISAESALGAMSARVRGTADLDPRLESSTRISEIRGARGLGIELGSLRADVNGVELVIDLSGADTIGDVRAILQNELKTVDVFASVSLGGGALQVTPSLGPITFSDLDGGTVAEDLGLLGSYIPGATSSGLDLDPELTELSSIASLPGVTLPMGSIRIENGGQVRVVDLSEVTTVGELFSAVDELQIGVRAEIDEDGRRINFRNELSGAHLSISEVAGGDTATQLGIRSLSGSTLLSDFNDGRGVGTVSGGFDPVTGLPDPSLDLDFEITLSDGTSFGVDISGATTVSDVLDAINAAAADQGIPVPGSFSADLMADGNGIELRDQLGGSGNLGVTRLNNSTAASDLGILGEGTGAVLAGTDQAQVAADGLFTHLAALRDALLTNDEAGIAFATEQLDADTLLVAEARAEVGVRSRRVTDSLAREEDRSIQDQSLRYTLRDLDFTEAATRFALLQQQLQASMATIGQTQQLSLLDFLR